MDKEELPEALVSAEADLRRIRSSLTEEQVNRADGKKVVVSLAEHWSQHKELYQTAGNMVWDQVRLELLEQLYGWRRQLGLQLQSQSRRSRTAGRIARDS